MLMKTILVASAALFALSGASWAADLPQQAGVLAPAAALPAPAWSGFYAGAHLGLHRSDTPFRVHS